MPALTGIKSGAGKGKDVYLLDICYGSIPFFDFYGSIIRKISKNEKKGHPDQTEYPKSLLPRFLKGVHLYGFFNASACCVYPYLVPLAGILP